MRYVIDAFNLIFKDRLLEDTLEAHGFVSVKESLCLRLERFAQAQKRQGSPVEILCVFDGSEKAAHRPRREPRPGGLVTAFYSDPYDKADRWIVDYVTAQQQPGGLVIVTSDKFILRETRRSGVRHQSPRDFLRGMNATVKSARDPLRGEDPRKFGGTPEREIDEWMRYFGFDEKS